MPWRVQIGIAGTIALVALGALACATRSPHAPRAEPPPPLAGPTAPLDPDARGWVEATLASLTLREKVGQLTNVWIPGSYVSTSSAEFDTLARWVEEEGLGGVTISMGLPHSYVAKLNALQRRAKVPLLVAADLESGPGMRLNNIYSIPHLLPQGGGTVFPPLMAFGAIGDERFVYELARITGIEARAVGVHANWAPVLDVNSNPKNPIINTRAFGEDPEQVARFGAAYIAGAHAAGLLATAKHFPGHGDTREDSHIEMAILEATRARLDSLELVPFRRAVESGVDAIMSAHVATPEILGPEGPPATLSPYFMTRLLREELGFQGLAVSDALSMGAIRGRYGVGEAAVLSIEAGGDVILFPPDLHAAIESVAASVEEGRISQARIDASVRRILEAKARVGLHRRRLVDIEAVDSIVGNRRHLAFAESAAARSITLVRDRAGLVPLGARVARVLSVTYARTEDPVAGRTFDRAIAATPFAGGPLPIVDTARVDPRTGASEYDRLRARADSADLVVISAYVPPEERVGTVGVSEAFAAFVTSLERKEQPRTPVAAIAFGSPYLLTAFPDVGTYLIAWGGQPLMQAAAARALRGEAAITGRLPISLPPFHRRGEGIERQAGLAASVVTGFDPVALGRVDAVIEAAIADSATPGASLAVGRRGGLARLRGYGRLDWNSASPEASDSTVWDIASLTKVVATTSAIMALVAEGKLDLDGAVSEHLSWFRGAGKEAITVRQLLLQRGGLPPFRPWWRSTRGRDAYRDSLAALELVAQPGDSTIYSDLGFIALGYLVEAVSGEPLGALTRERIFDPLGMQETMFGPPPSLLPRTAPTEVDTFAGRGHVRGVVHDENAWALGGVAGHAGLFSTAHDLARFAEALLSATRTGLGLDPAPAGGAPRVFDPAVVAGFVTGHDARSSRALGWDSPSEGSSAGRFLTGRAFGHTGFTGTSIWIDPELDLFVVLLTNRVNPTRENQKHLALRRAVHEAVACAITDARPAGCLPPGETAGNRP